MRNTAEQPHFLEEDGGPEASRLEKEARALFNRITSELDTRAFTLEDIHEAISQRCRQAHLDLPLQEGLIEFDSELQAYAVTPRGHDYEAKG